MKKPAVEMTAEELEAIVRTYIFGAHALVRAVAPGMMTRKHGHVLFTASMASLFGISQVSRRAAGASELWLGWFQCLPCRRPPPYSSQISHGPLHRHR